MTTGSWNAYLKTQEDIYLYSLDIYKKMKEDFALGDIWVPELILEQQVLEIL